MKKIILSLGIAFLIGNAFSQEKGTNEIGLTVGVLTTNDFVGLFSDVLTTSYSAGYVSYDKVSSSPSLGILYKRAIMDKWMVYADVVAQFSSKNVMYNNVNDGTVKNTFLTIGIGTDYHYVSTDWFQMYSGGSIAYCTQMWNYSSNNPDLRDGKAGFVNFQVNALGFRFGKKLGVSVELGLGYKGIAVGGLSYQF